MNVVIVEDEAITRAALKAAIRWEMGLTLVGEAGDGREALDIISRSKPDIVITDMRMPTMDGAEFLRELERVHPGCHKIVISAYTDFCYMRQAVVSGALDYLLKPISTDDLNRLLRRIVDGERAAIARTGVSTERAVMSKEEILSSLVDCFLPCREAILQRVHEPSFGVRSPSFVAQVIYLPDYEDEGFRRHLKGRPLYFYIWERVEDLLQGAQDAQFIKTVDAPSEMLVVWQVESSCPDMSLPGIRVMNSKLKGELYRLPATAFSTGFGRVYSDPAGIARSYREACMTARMMCRHAAASANVADIATVARWLDLYRVIPSDLEFTARALGSGREADVLLSVDRLFAHVARTVSWAQNACTLCDVFVDVLRQVAAEKEISLEAGPGDAWEDRLRVARDSGEIAAVRRWFESTIRGILARSRAVPTRAIMTDVKAYIRRWFYRDLSLGSVAREYHIHPVYLSRLFKEVVGESFTDYLTRVRLERASQLLRNPDLTVAEVAELVGYDNPYYFARLFRRRTGVYPSEVRTSS